MFAGQATQGGFGLLERDAVAAFWAILARRALARCVGGGRRGLVADAICAGAGDAEAVLCAAGTTRAELGADRFLAAVVGVAGGRVSARADVVWVVALDHVAELLSLGVEDPALVAGCAVGVAGDEGVVFVPALDPCYVVDAKETGSDFFAFVVFDHDRLLPLVELWLQKVAAECMGILEWDRRLQRDIVFSIRSLDG